MAKIGMYKRVNFTISRANSLGQYKIEADYYRKHVVTYTTDSGAYDFIDDDKHPEKCKEAIMHCYNKIVLARKELG